jgi:hypothetical protein
VAHPCRTYTDIAEVEADYKEGLLHPGDLKAALSRGLNEILQVVRPNYFVDCSSSVLVVTVGRKLCITMGPEHSYRHLFCYHSKVAGRQELLLNKKRQVGWGNRLQSSFVYCLVALVV